MIDFIEYFDDYSHFESDSHMEEISTSENLNNEHQKYRHSVNEHQDKVKISRVIESQLCLENETMKLQNLKLNKQKLKFYLRKTENRKRKTRC